MPATSSTVKKVKVVVDATALLYSCRDGGANELNKWLEEGRIELYVPYAELESIQKLTGPHATRAVQWLDEVSDGLGVYIQGSDQKIGIEDRDIKMLLDDARSVRISEKLGPTAAILTQAIWIAYEGETDGPRLTQPPVEVFILSQNQNVKRICTCAKFPVFQVQDFEASMAPIVVKSKPKQQPKRSPAKAKFQNTGEDRHGRLEYEGPSDKSEHETAGGASLIVPPTPTRTHTPRSPRVTRAKPVDLAGQMQQMWRTGVQDANDGSAKTAQKVASPKQKAASPNTNAATISPSSFPRRPPASGKTLWTAEGDDKE